MLVVLNKFKTYVDYPKPFCLERRRTCAGTSFEPFRRRTIHFRHFRIQTGISPSNCFWLHSSLSLLRDVDQTHLDTIRNGRGLLLASKIFDEYQRRILASWKNLWKCEVKWNLTGNLHPCYFRESLSARVRYIGMVEYSQFVQAMAGSSSFSRRRCRHCHKASLGQEAFLDYQVLDREDYQSFLI